VSLPIAPFPPELVAPAAAAAPFVDALAAADLPPGAMCRVTFGDLDVLLAHTSDGVVAVDDRCPHMAAPLSLGELDGCVVACPLHRGQFDLGTGDVVRMPTTGGLLPDGTYVPVWAPEGQPPKPDVPGLKADARRLTRVRRFRYYPVRLRDGRLEIRIPADPDVSG
jgi:3-phenylpropionate/trans-cinnamate dioxygenase ferredoxin subunit